MAIMIGRLHEGRSTRRRCASRLVVAAVAIAVTLGAGVAANLTDCPDCGGGVSQRAVLCPHCGCPGEAIAEAVAQAKEDAPEPRLGPVIRVNASAGSGYGIAIAAGGHQYLLMDARLLWEADSLTITPTTTNSPIAYRGLQLAKDVPLARFRTDATNLTYLAVAQATVTPEKELQWLLPSPRAEGSLVLESIGTDADDVPRRSGQLAPVAAVDVRTNLVGVAFRRPDDGHDHAFPIDSEWLDASPGVLRAQTRLLARAEKERTAGRLTPETRRQLSDTEWLTKPLRLKADAVTQSGAKE